jgi:nicotinate-nucleotide adenylyltransferase
VSERLAVFGGSFDPPHVGHVLAASYVLATAPVDRVLVVPTARHAFGKQLSAFEHRLQMCALAFACLPGVHLSAIERDLPMPSLTLRTLEALATAHPKSSMRLIIGSDLLHETHAWHAFERVRELAPLIVVERQGYEQAGSDAPSLPRVSSTEMRERLRTGRSTSGWLAPQVARYALDHTLYTSR